MRVVLLAMVMVGLACGAAPQARLTPEQQALSKERDTLWEQAHAEWKAGKQAEAVATMGKALAVTERVYGNQAWLTHVTEHWLAFWEEQRGRLAEAADHRERMWRVMAAMRGADDWKTVDARLELAEALAQTKRTPAQREVPSRATSLLRQAFRLSEQGKRGQALPLYKQALDITKEALGERHPLYATSLNSLALLHHAMGDHKAALPLYQQALAMRKGVLGERHPHYATGLHNLALLHSAMGDNKAARPLYQKALAIRKEALGVRHPDYAHSLVNLAALHQDMGDNKAALPLLEQARGILKGVLGERHPHYAASLINLAALHEAIGDHKAALPLYKQALAIYKEVLGGRHPDYATSLNSLAGLHLEMGDHKAALPLYKEALAIRKGVLGERHPDYATSLNNLAMLHKAMGDHTAALPLLQRALAITREAQGERHSSFADSLNNLALLHLEMGDHKAALPLLRQALAITKEALGERHPSYATSLQNLAGLHRDMGDHKSALPLFQKVLAIAKEALGVGHPQYAISLNNLAGLHKDMGDPRAALPLIMQALANSKEALGVRHPHYATTLNNLAVTFHDLGENEAALPLSKQALAIRKAALGERHPDYADSLSSLASLHKAMGDNKAALPLYKQALDIKKEALGEKHPSYALSLNNLAALHQAMGRPGTALLLQEQCLAVTRRQLAANADVQSERQQLAAAGLLRYQLNRRLSMPDEAAHFSHTHAMSWKGAAFAAQQARRLFVAAHADPATRAIAGELMDATRSLALLSSRADKTSRGRAVEYARIKEEKEIRLAELSEPFRASLKPPPSEAFRAGLPPGVVLVDLLAYGGHDPAKPAKGQTSQHRLVAWVVRADAPTVRIDLGLMRPVELAITSWREAMEKGGTREDAPRKLRGLVWQPLERHLAGAKFVLISPDGALGRLPFAALPGSKAGTFLLEEVPLAFMPIPRVLPRLLQPARGKSSLLALGGVEFGDGIGTWAALPATVPEADAVAARFRARFKGETVSLSGGKATRAALRESLPRHRYTHLATHGFFAPPSMKSALDREDKRPGLFEREGVTGLNPGLLSGLVLAGANKNSPEDDGILTALEIAEMDLSGVELAVLSACQTGLGKEAAGEGMLGLQRAFAVAGCKSVVSSLWSVDDVATSVLMERFYFHLWEKKRWWP